MTVAMDAERTASAKEQGEGQKGAEGGAAMVSAVARKDEGNARFTSGDYEGAKDAYKKALEELQDRSVVATGAANALACKIHTNLAAALMKLELPEEAITHCKLALAIDAKNVKALFRRAECLKRLGKYAEALEQLERALLLENNNEAIRESMDDCEDLLDQLHATGGVHDDAGSRSSRAREEDLCREDENALPDDVVVAAETKLEEIRDKVLLGGQAGVSEHVMLNHGSNTFGMIEIKDAFQSPSNLSSALQFVRSQHFTATAKYAFVIVQKSKMMYPHVWWAHPWPFTSDMEKDGIFLEAHTRDAHSTWFIPLEGAKDCPIPQREVLLHKECKLLDEPIFP